MTVCFTGHRALPEEGTPAYARLVTALDAAIDDAIAAGCTAFIAGGAAGFDTLCAERVLLRKAKTGAVTLSVYLPYAGFGSGFPAPERKRALRVREACDRTVVVSERAYALCYAMRNKRMVADADAVIAYLREPKSGTGQTVRMAKEKGVPVTFLPVE